MKMKTNLNQSDNNVYTSIHTLLSRWYVPLEMAFLDDARAEEVRSA
jgi:hypothetical protein